ncbi:acyl-CoA dehydrogenase family protein [Stakelama sediminis]|uniref:Putative acyl-CoA dehydrogenase n=1 Tax=Stakelama sediminis TaxID=463200 RepID=A0A840YU97_9SPHN|nr:acyl-CoA dehydrogenase family protein [Stakelama sediminis]MBB5717208.1 putative acyl-CoA dehydrogenase [Stakelama sediminis]
MQVYKPATRLETHEVTNQPPPLVNRNFYHDDVALREGVLRGAGQWLDERMTALGAAVGSDAVLDLGVEANRNPPVLEQFDRYGRRIDAVRFHPAYHRLMALAMEHHIHDIAWTTEAPGRHLAHAAMLALFTEAEAGVMCPINMSYAGVPALRTQPDVAAPWLDALLGGSYDAPLRPIAEKAGITLGMAMTEKQGGSDVRANSTRAEPVDRAARLWRLTGHKWFCSAPMSDGFLTLAYGETGLSCFLVPRIAPDGERNAIHVMRLKDKLGNRSNASSEIEYHGALGWLLGEEGRGVQVIIDMVHHTRLGTIAGTLGIMRRALAEAVNHAQGRRVFQKKLIDQPAMRGVLADLALEYEAAVALVVRVACAFDDEDAAGRAFARLAVAVAKYWLTRRNPAFVFECMECLGGAGYVEEGPMPRLFRESPLNAIWEGSGNVIALDVLRTLAKAPLSGEVFLAELASERGKHGRFDAALDSLSADLSRPVGEAQARALVGRMALLLQAALLLRDAPAAVAEAFCETRLAGDGRLFGTLPDNADVEAILARQLL